MSKKTPAKTPRQQAKMESVSPMRITRLEEKTQLQKLNQRLEHYILKQRERDASQGAVQQEVDALKKLYEDETVNLRADFDERLEALRNEREGQSSALFKIEEENKRLKRAAEKAADEVASLSDSNDRLLAQVEELGGKKAEAESKYVRESELRSQLAAELERSKRHASELNKSIEEGKGDSEDAWNRAAAAEGRLANLEEDLKAEQARAERELGQLREKVTVLTRKVTQVEDQTRKEFVKQLEELMEERTQEFEKDKEDAVQALKAIYDEKLNAYREHLERAGHELEEMRAKLADATKKEEQAKAAAADATDQKAALEHRVEELEQIAEAERKRPSVEIAELREINRRLKASFKRKDKEFDDLMDVKIALAMEIKQYQELLDREEERLNNLKEAAAPADADSAGSDVAPAPKKKRRRAAKKEDRIEADAPAAESQSNDPLILRVDAHGDHIVVKNNTTDAISLSNWTLQTKKKKEFAFGDVSLNPTEGVRVVTVMNEEDNQAGDLFWVEEGGVVFEASSDDTVMLVDPTGRVVQEHEVIPSKPLVAGAGDKKDNCSVM